MIRHDLTSPAEASSVCGSQRRRARGSLDLPETLHHELEVRRLDPACAAVRLRDRPEPARPELDLTRTDAVQHVLDERRPPPAPAPPRARSTARAARGWQPGPPAGRAGRDAGRCRTDAGPAPLRRSSRASVSSRSDTRTFTRRARLRARRGPPRAVRVGLIRELLLRLVEDHVDVALDLGSLGDLEQPAALDAGRRGERLGERRSPASSAQAENTTTSGSSGRSRSDRATLASRSDDFPTPLGP